MPLDAAGFSATTRNQYLAIGVDAMEAELGLVVDLEADRVLATVLALVADNLGKQSEGVQFIYDSTVRNNATGVQLADLCAAVNVHQFQAVASTVSLLLTGDNNLEIPAGRIVSGGVVTTTRWETLEDVTLSATGSALVSARATETGPLQALATDIDTIITPVTGWDGVTNLSAAAIGSDLESEAALRLRRTDGTQTPATATNQAIQANILLAYQTTGVTDCVVLDNQTAAVVVIGGKSLEPHSTFVLVHPDTLTDDQKVAVAAIIYEQDPTGIYTNGADVLVEVQKVNLETQTIRFDFVDLVAVPMFIRIVVAPGFAYSGPGGVQTGTYAAIAALFESLRVGQGITLLEVSCAVAAVAGVKGIDLLTIDGVAVDYETLLTEKAIQGSTVVQRT